MLYYLPILVAAVVYLVRIMEVKRKRDTVAGKVQENLTFQLFLIIGTLMTFGSVAEYVILRKGNFSWIALIAGLICAIVSFKLRWAAIAALGKFWSLHVEMRENHEFVQSGPFRYLRHPTYFSMILELVAFGLICLLNAQELASGSGLARAFCGYVAVFWGVRLALQALLDVEEHLTRWWLRAGYRALTLLFVGVTIVFAWAALGPLF